MVRSLLIFSLFISLSACQTLSLHGNKKDKEREEEEGRAAAAADPRTTTLPVGIVEHVDSAAGFVLIRSRKGMQLEPGTTLTLHGAPDEPGAVVSVSPARKGVFLTADILQGTPQKGQHVTMEYIVGANGQVESLSAIDDRNAIQVLE